MKERNPHALRGVACSALGGVCWGFSGTCVRLLAGGILLTVPAVLRRRESVKGIFRGPKDLLRLICYGICGLLLCQYAYMTAISYSNAATITVLQNLGCSSSWAIPASGAAACPPGGRGRRWCWP